VSVKAATAEIERNDGFLVLEGKWKTMRGKT
jgi:hypothetical protein